MKRSAVFRQAHLHRILQQHVTGITDRSRKRHLPSPPLCIPDGAAALGLNTLLTSFLLLAVAVFAALVMLLLEVLYNRYVKRLEPARALEKT